MMFVTPTLAHENAEPSDDARPRQHIHLLTTQYWYTGPANLVSSNGLPNLTFNTHTLRIKGLVGTVLESTGSTLFAGIRYDMTMDEHGTAGQAQRQDLLHGGFFRMGFIQGFNERWGIMVFGVAGLASDLGAVQADDLRYTIGGGADYVFDQDFRFTAGLMWTDDWFEPTILPLLHMYWYHHPFRLEVRIPQELDVWYVLAPDLELGFLFRAVNLRYCIHDPHWNIDEYYALNLPWGPALRWYVSQHWFVTVQVGGNIRYFTMIVDGHEDYEWLDLAGWHGSVRFGYVL